MDKDFCLVRSYLGRVCLLDKHHAGEVHRADDGTRWRGDGDRRYDHDDVENVIAKFRALTEVQFLPEEEQQSAGHLAWNNLIDPLAKLSGVTWEEDSTAQPNLERKP